METVQQVLNQLEQADADAYASKRAWLAGPSVFQQHMQDKLERLRNEYTGTGVTTGGTSATRDERSTDGGISRGS